MYCLVLIDGPRASHVKNETYISDEYIRLRFRRNFVYKVYGFKRGISKTEGVIILRTRAHIYYPFSVRTCLMWCHVILRRCLGWMSKIDQEHTDCVSQVSASLQRPRGVLKSRILRLKSNTVTRLNYLALSHAPNLLSNFPLTRDPLTAEEGKLFFMRILERNHGSPCTRRRFKVSRGSIKV